MTDSVSKGNVRVAEHFVSVVTYQLLVVAP